MMSEDLPERNSGRQRRTTATPTWRGVDGFGLPLWVEEVLLRGVVVLRDQSVVLVLQLLPFDKGLDDAADGVGAVAEVASDRVRHFVEEHAEGVEDAEAADGGDVLRDHISRLGAGVEEAFDVAAVSGIMRALTRL